MALLNDNQSVQNQPTKSKKNVVFTFVSSANGIRSSYAAQKRTLCEGLQAQRWFEEGQLLDTMEKGVIFPLIHHSVVHQNNKPSVLLLDGSSLDRDVKLQQGLYSEIRSFTPPRSSITGTQKPPMDGVSSFRAWIFMGFKTLDDTFSEVLEDNWKDWTGARVIYMNLSDEFGVSRFSFYRRQSPRDMDVFMYIMTVECDHVNAENRIKLLDFVQKLRVERMIGYLSVYRVTDKPPSTASVINGLLADAVDTSRENSAI